MIMLFNIFVLGVLFTYKYNDFFGSPVLSNAEKVLLADKKKKELEEAKEKLIRAKRRIRLRRHPNYNGVIYSFEKMMDKSSKAVNIFSKKKKVENTPYKKFINRKGDVYARNRVSKVGLLNTTTLNRLVHSFSFLTSIDLLRPHRYVAIVKGNISKPNNSHYYFYTNSGNKLNMLSVGLYSSLCILVAIFLLTIALNSQYCLLGVLLNIIMSDKTNNNKKHSIESAVLEINDVFELLQLVDVLL